MLLIPPATYTYTILYMVYMSRVTKNPTGVSQVFLLEGIHRQYRGSEWRLRLTLDIPSVIKLKLEL